MLNIGFSGNLESITCMISLLHLEMKAWRSSHQRCFLKKGVLINFAKFTGKHLCHSLFFNKVADLRSADLLKKKLWDRCFPVNFAKFIRTPFFTEDLRWLLLSVWNLSKIQLYIFLINVERISLIVLVFSLFVLNK